jgi:hypothetical protein
MARRAHGRQPGIDPESNEMVLNREAGEWDVAF